MSDVAGRPGAAGAARAPEGPGGPLAAPRETDLIEDFERLLAALESHPDRTVRDQVRALLERVDAVHRTALTRLMGAIHAMAGEAFINRLAADPAIRLLLMSYDLLAVDRRLLAEEALDSVRGHLHRHGIDVELTAVTGGTVAVKLHGPAAPIPVEAVRHDVEAALAAGLPGFQELTIGDRAPSGKGHRPAPPAPLLQIGAGRLREPVYRAACAASAVPAGTMRAVELDGEPILIANVDGDVHALADRCGDSPLPLRFGSLEGAALRCSWHGCRYDVRSGARLDRPGEPARVYPVKIETGEIRVAVATAPRADG
jgi:nitrite reductase/ring-hydroxylating ferredoxin subunit